MITVGAWTIGRLPGGGVGVEYRAGPGTPAPTWDDFDVDAALRANWKRVAEELAAMTPLSPIRQAQKEPGT